MPKLASIIVCTEAILAISGDDWENWKTLHGKTYNGNDEESKRRSIFNENLIRYAKLQKQNPQAQFGPTKFSDMSAEEFKNAFLNYRPSNRTLPNADISHLSTTVADRDWTGVLTTPVKDQGSCGSCWAFSAVEQIESDYIKAGGQHLALSVQAVNDCTYADDVVPHGGCEGGDPYDAFGEMQSWGLPLESSYPYTGVDGVCHTYTPVVEWGSFQWLARNSEDMMQSYVSETGTLSVCVDASTWDGYQGGVMTSCGHETDHCVQIVGVSGGAWKIRNSWGTGWGEAGFLRLATGSNLCNIASEPSIVTANPPVAPTPPPPTTTPCPGCCDHQTSCLAWKNAGYCTTPTEIDYMRANCCKTCGFGNEELSV